MKLANIKSLINKYKYFIFDCDGVLFRGNKVISNSFETLNYIKRQNKKYALLTNNSLRSRSSFLSLVK